VALLICWFNAALRATQDSFEAFESNFRSLVMNAPYGICRCNALGILQDANPAMVAMFGYESAAELRGGTWEACMRMRSSGFNRRLLSRTKGIQQPHHGMRAQGWGGHRGANIGTLDS